MNQTPPVIIIGAGRSGTNMLRDLLVKLPGLATWPCDEINYIWRHGNRGYPTDQFTPDMATSRVQRYIRNQFDALARRSAASTVVEKTCANSLRCGFVNEVVPDAKFIHIVRDGRDVALSANMRWKAKLDVPYILRKARYVPLSDLPYYASQYFMNRVGRLASKDGRLSVWGPRFDAMQDVFEDHPILIACAIQWQVCVTAADDQLAKLESERVLTVRYEDFTHAPQENLGRICEFLEQPITKSKLDQLTTGVSTKSVGQWRKRLDVNQLQQMQSHVGATLAKWGYERSSGAPND